MQFTPHITLMDISKLVTQGIKDPTVLAAFKKVKREDFLPNHLKLYAEVDKPFSIGFDQTISQPYIVAFMTEALDLQSTDKVLEIGTGSGFQAAILAEIVDQVYSIEIIQLLLERAKNTLQKLGYKNIFIKNADGFFGWSDQAPFDKVILTAAPECIPSPLIEQLKVGGCLIAPIGADNQKLIRIKKTQDGVLKEDLLNVRFVPMTGAAQN